MRIITANTNGIRAAARKGFFEWLATQDADVVCIQETKAQREQLDDPQFHPDGYSVMYSDRERHPSWPAPRRCWSQTAYTAK